MTENQTTIARKSEEQPFDYLRLPPSSAASPPSTVATSLFPRERARAKEGRRKNDPSPLM